MRDCMVQLEKAGVRRVLAHSEKSAAYMADGYARVKKAPGVCLAQSVGAANLAAGLQDAYLGHSPVIALTGKKPPSHQHRNAYQEINHTPVFEPVTKFNVSLDDPEQLPRLLRQAFREATSGRPGPTHIDTIGVVGHISDRHVFDSTVDRFVEKPYCQVPPHRPLPEQAAVEEAARLLAAAERPVLVCGGGAVASGAGAEIKRLAESQMIPVAVTLNGKTTIPDGHPLKVGVVGSYSSRCANQLVCQADLVVYVGSGTGDMSTNEWTVPKPGTPVIQIDIDPRELGRNYPNQVGLLGDARQAVGLLNQCLPASKGREQWMRQARGLVDKWRSDTAPLRTSDEIPMRVERLCQELSDWLPQDVVLVADTGFAGTWTGVMVDLKYPDQTYIRAAGSLGWAFPASLGAKCAAPEQPVVCFTGDGGFWYHIAELETAARCGINTITVVNNNHGFGQCVETVEKAYIGYAGKKEEIFKFREIDFVKIAEQTGCLGIRVESPDQIAPALARGLAAEVPVVIDVQTDLMCRPEASWSPSETAPEAAE
jgi:acetolactate synthase-1/2/3 large subunit